METEIYFDCRTAEEWAAVTTVIPKGFVCVEQGTELTKIKIGDGEKTYSELPYASRDYSDLYTRDELYNREEIDEKLGFKADADHVHEDLRINGGTVTSADFCPITLNSESGEGVAIGMNSNDTESGKVGFDSSGNFIVRQGADAAANSLEISNATKSLKTGAAGTLIYSTTGMASERNITIENLADYSAFAVHITGEGVNHIPFAVNAIVPVAYLAASSSNSFDICGGIPSSDTDFAGYITASIPSNNKLRLRLFSDGICMLIIKIVVLY